MRELLHNPEDAAASQYRGGGGRLQAIADPLLPPFRVSPETPRAVASRGVRISGVRAPYPQAGSRPASTRGTTSLRIGSVPSARSALI